jgi:hypothetical protein
LIHFVFSSTDWQKNCLDFIVCSWLHCAFILLRFQNDIVPLFYCPFRLVLYFCFITPSYWYFTWLWLSLHNDSLPLTDCPLHLFHPFILTGKRNNGQLDF